jgi:hypothetical protein
LITNNTTAFLHEGYKVALDRNFRLRNIAADPIILRDNWSDKLISVIKNKHYFLNALAIENIAGKKLSIAFEERYGKFSAIYIPPLPSKQLVPLLQDLFYATGNIYKILYKYGCTLISNSTLNNDAVLLSGGSYSTVSLAIHENIPVIRKIISERVNGHQIDTVQRLQNEGKWLANLPNQAKYLFPDIKTVYDGKPYWGYEMEFLPWGSLAELVFQNCLDGNGLYSTISNIYMKLVDDLYCHTSQSSNFITDEENYIDKIKRRTAFIHASEYPEDGVIRKIYKAPWVEINGLRCLTQSQLLRNLETTKKWNNVLDPQGGRLVHGDLILEDILVNPKNTKEFRLIDPNPNNGSVLYDVAKTMLSLWIGYEFYYYDLFEFRSIHFYKDGGVKIEIEFTRSDCVDTYKVASEKFINFVIKKLSPLLGLELELIEPQLRMTSALQSLAIPMFHLLHHKKEMRALAFISAGLYHAQIATNEIDTLVK